MNNLKKIFKNKFHFKQYDSYKSCLYDQKAKTLPKLPTNTDEIVFRMHYTLTNYGEPFLLFDTKDGDRIICFSSLHQLKCLSISVEWHIDGTFGTSPYLYYQMYIISAWYLGEMHPCCFVFLKNKKQSTYYRMLECLKNSAKERELNLNPEVNFKKHLNLHSSYFTELIKLILQIILSDFELGAMNAFHLHFGNATIKGCYFHYSQAIWKNISDKGLKKHYQESILIKKWLKQFKALAIVPETLVLVAWNHLIQIRPHEEYDKISDFINYFYNTWITGPFKPAIWNHFETVDSPRTNNHVEGFNYALKACINKEKPNIYVVIDKLKQMETIITANFLRLNQTKIPKKRLNINISRDLDLCRCKLRLLSGELTLPDFMIRSAGLFSFNLTKLKDPDSASVITQEQKETVAEKNKDDVHIKYCKLKKVKSIVDSFLTSKTDKLNFIFFENNQLKCLSFLDDIQSKLSTVEPLVTDFSKPLPNDELPKFATDDLMLLDNTSWLSDMQITFALRALKRDFPAISGFDNVCNFSTESNIFKASNMQIFNYQSPSIFIFHCFSHWITVTNIAFYPNLFNPNQWYVYDSLNGLHYFTAAIGIVKEINPYAYVQRVQVQQQNGLNDCGLFAIANAVSLCNNKDPSKTIYNQNKMRYHFNTCVLRRQISIFP